VSSTVKMDETLSADTVGGCTRLHVITSLKTAVFMTVFEDPHYTFPF